MLHLSQAPATIVSKTTALQSLINSKISQLWARISASLPCSLCQAQLRHMCWQLEDGRPLGLPVFRPVSRHLYIRAWVMLFYRPMQSTYTPYATTLR